MSNIKTIVPEHLFEILKEVDKPLIVYITAGWCAPCRQLKPIIEDIATEYKDKITIGLFDAGASANTAQKLGIRSVPTLLFYKDGVQVHRTTGLQTKKIITDYIKLMLE